MTETTAKRKVRKILDTTGGKVRIIASIEDPVVIELTDYFPGWWKFHCS